MWPGEGSLLVVRPHRLGWLLAALVALSSAWIAAPRRAEAKTKVELATVEWPGSTSDKARDKSRDKRVRRTVRNHASHAAAKLDFGARGRVTLTLVIKELEVIETDGLVRVTCTLVGKLNGGGHARSKLSFGGKPADRKRIERQVLSAVTDGVMTRLAELAKQRERDRAKAEKSAPGRALEAPGKSLVPD